MHPLPRRRFIKGLFLGTVFSSTVGKAWSSAYAATFSPASQDPTFRINVSDYPVLSEEIGSIRLGVCPVGPDEFPAGRYYPVIVNRDASGFYVVDATCKHAGCVVGTFTSADFAMRCPCHGSLYEISGTYIEGPADGRSLDALPFFFEGTDTLVITVPDMGFNVQTFLPNRQPNARVQLQFVAQGGVFYEVRFREKLTDVWQPVSFSRTPTGPANQQILLGDGDPNTVYVDRTTATGFYAVSMRLDEV